MTRKRKLATLNRADLGKRISFTALSGRQIQDATLRAFTHGVFSNAKGEIDSPLVGINVYTYRSHEHHWARPDDLATLEDAS